MLYVRALLVDAAAEGARVAARADTVTSDGVVRTSTLISGALSSRFADDITVRETSINGLPVMEVIVHAPLPVVGTLGPSGVMTAVGHAVKEPE